MPPARRRSNTDEALAVLLQQPQRKRQPIGLLDPIDTGW